MKKRASSSKRSNWQTSSKMDRNKRSKLPVSGRSEMEDITIDLADMNTSNKEILKITSYK